MRSKAALYEDTNRVYSAANPPPDDNLSIYPTGAFRLSMPRFGINGAALTTLSTGRLAFVAVPLRVGETVTSISWMSGSTAGASLTHAWFSLYSGARAKLAVTSDDTASTWVVNTVKTLNLTTPYAVTTSGLYYIGICVVGTTVPTLIGAAGPIGTSNGLAPAVVGTSSTGLTNPASAPSTAAALSAIAGHPWCYLS